MTEMQSNGRIIILFQNVSCSCLSAQPSGGGLTACTHPCAGDPSETCGGFDPDFPTDAIIFNYVNTDSKFK